MTKKVTVATSKPRMIGGNHLLWGRSEVIETVEEAGSEPEAQAAAQNGEHALYARNLCPVCPSGVLVKSRSIFDRYFSKRTFSYCEHDLRDLPSANPNDRPPQAARVNHQSRKAP